MLDKETALLMVDAMLAQLVALKQVIEGTYDGDPLTAECDHDIMWTGDGSGMCRKAACAEAFPPGTLDGDVGVSPDDTESPQP